MGYRRGQEHGEREKYQKEGDLRRVKRMELHLWGLGRRAMRDQRGWGWTSAVEDRIMESSSELILRQ